MDQGIARDDPSHLFRSLEIPGTTHAESAWRRQAGAKYVVEQGCRGFSEVQRQQNAMDAHHPSALSTAGGESYHP